MVCRRRRRFVYGVSGMMGCIFFRVDIVGIPLNKRNKFHYEIYFAIAVVM